MNLGSFAVDTVVLHDVPRSGSDDGGLVLTDEPIPLDDQLRDYFRRKIVQSIRTRGVEVVADPNEDPTARDAVAEIIADSSSLVAESQGLAKRLYEVQDARNSPGLVAVAAARIDNKSCVAILKLEREQGLRFHIEVDDGRAVVDLELLRDLTLTDKTKVFKTSILRLATTTASSLEGRVSDDQRGRDEAGGVASFFLGRYLGCMLKTNPEKATLDFVRAAEEFFNTGVINVEKRAQYQVALLAKMQDNTLDVRPRDFASGHLEAQHQSGFLEQVREAGLDPDTPFEKDVALAKVAGFRMIFESGMALIGKMNDLDQRVKPRPDGSGVEINDAIARLQGR
jgi:hypothetical protein